jgi:hypothetical protein
MLWYLKLYELDFVFFINQIKISQGKNLWEKPWIHYQKKLQEEKENGNSLNEGPEIF